MIMTGKMVWSLFSPYALWQMEDVSLQHGQEPGKEQVNLFGHRQLEVQGGQSHSRYVVSVVGSEEKRRSAKISSTI